MELQATYREGPKLRERKSPPTVCGGKANVLWGTVKQLREHVLTLYMDGVLTRDEASSVAQIPNLVQQRIKK